MKRLIEGLILLAIIVAMIPAAAWAQSASGTATEASPAAATDTPTGTATEASSTTATQAADDAAKALPWTNAEPGQTPDAVAPETLPETLAKGSVLEVANGASLDLDGDGTKEAITFTLDVADEFEGKYVLKINDAQVNGEGCCLTGRLHAMRLNTAMNEAFLLVSEYGPSDDNACYVYCYSEGKLTYAGLVASAPEDIAVNGAQFSAVVRGSVLQTWFRPADFTIARSYKTDENGVAIDAPMVVEVPRAVYPMGTIVTAKLNLDLRVSPIDGKTALTVKKGDKVILSATDDVEWLYVVPMTEQADAMASGGWLRLQDQSVIVGKKVLNGDAVFDGLLYAD